MEHTPGPWRINTKGTIGNQIEADSGERIYEGDDGYRGVALFMSCCSSRNYTEEEANRMANARLIAAAPMLLEAAALALKIAEGWIDDRLAGTSSYAEALAELEPVRAAISAARQESAS